jgi:hypothetical protein
VCIGEGFFFAEIHLTNRLHFDVELGQSLQTAPERAHIARTSF